MPCKCAAKPPKNGRTSQGGKSWCTQSVHGGPSPCGARGWQARSMLMLPLCLQADAAARRRKRGQWLGWQVEEGGERAALWGEERVPVVGPGPRVQGAIKNNVLDCFRGSPGPVGAGALAGRAAAGEQAVCFLRPQVDAGAQLGQAAPLPLPAHRGEVRRPAVRVWGEACRPCAQKAVHCAAAPPPPPVCAHVWPACTVGQARTRQAKPQPSSPLRRATPGATQDPLLGWQPRGCPAYINLGRTP